MAVMRASSGGASFPVGVGRAAACLLFVAAMMSLLPAAAARAADSPQLPRPLPMPATTQPEPSTPRDAPHPPIVQAPPTPVWYGPLGTVILSVALAFVQLAKKFYRFLGLGIYLNWTAAAFLFLAGLVSFVLHQTAVPSLVTMTGVSFGPLTPVASSISANVIGALVYGFGREKKKGQDLKANVDGLLFRLIQDRIRIQNGIAMNRLARETDYQLIKAACQRLIDDDIPFGNIPADKRDAILETLAKGQPAGLSPDDQLRLKHRLLLSAIEVTSFNDVRAALRRATAVPPAAPPEARA